MTTEALVASTDTQSRLQNLLRLDAIIVGPLGLLLALTPTTWYGDLPGWVSRTAGSALVLAAVLVVVFARWTGQRLRTAATITAESAFLWTAASGAAIVMADIRGYGLEVVGATALATLVLGIAELRLARRLR